MSLWKLNTNAKTFRKNRNKFDNLDIWQIHNKYLQKRKKTTFSQSKYTRQYKFECQILFERWEISLRFSC